MAAPAAGAGRPLRGRPRRGPAVLGKAQEYADAGDLGFAAELLKHAVFADPDSSVAKNALAEVYPAPRLRSREPDLAQLLPPRRARAPQRHHAAAPRRRRRHGGGAHGRAALRLPRHPRRRLPAPPPTRSPSSGASPTSPPRSAPPCPTAR
ncbi:alkyl sulfatase dimerization domain-containing protein [Amycolatopsis sp. NPDC023774]|uniref:alkyl sulfatase dimerization domain-containing protein n=1 Tax=Amycolatopsis sp. NPDC023774 TaxID=3155015 RepID=UPI0033D90BFA